MKNKNKTFLKQFQKVKKIIFFPVFKKKISYGFLKFWRWNWKTIKEFFKIFLFASLVILTLIVIDAITKSDLFSVSEEEGVDTASQISDTIIKHLDDNYFSYRDKVSDCNVMDVQLFGDLYTYLPNDARDQEGNNIQDIVSADDLIGIITEAKNDDKIKAIIMEVDSTGGYPVAAEEVANALKGAGKPTVALIRQTGVSAAYWSSTGADIIFASALSDVGGIGVTTSYLDNTKKNQKDGLTFNELSTGKFKDTGSPDKPLTAEESQLFMRDLNIANGKFINQVAVNRKLPEDKVRALADGSSVLGEAALQAGLIDRIGGFAEVKKYLEEKIGEKVNICGY